MTETGWWLVKSEPGTYSWEDLIREKKCIWDGVRSYAARNFLAAMKKGDRVFLYHSGDDKAVVGLMQVGRAAFPDPTMKKDESWVAVEFRPLKKAKLPLNLKEMKSIPSLSEMKLLKIPRLSVMPLTSGEVKILLDKTGLNE